MKQATWKNVAAKSFLSVLFNKEKRSYYMLQGVLCVSSVLLDQILVIEPTISMVDLVYMWLSDCVLGVKKIWTIVLFKEKYFYHAFDSNETPLIGLVEYFILSSHHTWSFNDP